MMRRSSNAGAATRRTTGTTLSGWACISTTERHPGHVWQRRAIRGEQAVELLRSRIAVVGGVPNLMLTQHDESSAVVQAPVDRVFAYVDEHTRLASHMSQSSWKMGGGRMTIALDEGRGQRVGSRIRLTGRVLGMPLAVEETVIERAPPHRKVWETMGSPKLIVIGHYRMGFEVTPQGQSSRLRVFLHYALPERAPARWLGRLFGRYYARWCTQQMVDDAIKYFALVR